MMCGAMLHAFTGLAIHEDQLDVWGREGSALFRKTLEGRFVLDVVRTILQTAVAAGAPVHDYLVSVLRTSEDEIASAWALANVKAPLATPPAK